MPPSESRFLARLRRTRNDKPNLMTGPNLWDALCARESGAPDGLLGVKGREHDGLVVDFGGVLVDGGGGLGAEVAVAGIEVEGADVVGAMGAGKLHAALDASDGVLALHNSSVVF